MDDRVKLLIVEYWDVPEDRMEAFRSYYEDVFMKAIDHVPGYAGTTLLEKRRGGAHAMPGPRKAVTPHRGMNTRDVRTNLMIDFDALLDNEYTLASIHYFVEKPSFKQLGDDFTSGWEKVRATWRQDYPELDDPWDALNREFFSLVLNHWDVVYDVSAVNRSAALQEAPPSGHS